MFETKFLGGTMGPLSAGDISDITRSYELAIIEGAAVLFIALGLSLVIKAPEINKPI